MSVLPNNPIAYNEAYKSQDLRKRNSNTYHGSNIFGVEEENNQKRNEGRVNPTYSSNIFEGNIVPFQQKTSLQSNYNLPGRSEKIKNKDHGTADLFGTYEAPKEYKENIANFEPNYVAIKASEKKLIDDLGFIPEFIPKNDYPSNPEVRSEISYSNPIQRRVCDQNSDIFNVNDREKNQLFQNAQNSKRQEENAKRFEEPVPQKFAIARKQNEMSSNIFNVDYAPSEKVIPSSSEFTDTNLEKRKNNKNFSDLFGLASYESNPNSKKAITPTTVNWSQVDSVKSNPFKYDLTKKAEENLQKNSEIRKKEGLQSCLDNFDYSADQQNYEMEVEDDTQKNFTIENGISAKDLTKLQNSSKILPSYSLPIDNNINQDVQIYEYDIKSLDGNFEDKKFKRNCLRSGYHIVEFQTSYNTISNSLNNGGKITMRIANGESNETVKNKLFQMGLNVEEKKLKLAKTNDTYIDTQNLDWKDKTVELVGKHYKNSNFQNAGEAKLRELESQGDIFGNSEGVGKWGSEWKETKMQKKKNPDEITKEDVMQYGNWNKAMKELDYKMKKFTPVLKKNEESNIYQTYAVRNSKK